jgi:hypothetical protein
MADGGENTGIIIEKGEWMGHISVAKQKIQPKHPLFHDYFNTRLPK